MPVKFFKLKEPINALSETYPVIAMTQYDSNSATHLSLERSEYEFHTPDSIVLSRNIIDTLPNDLVTINMNSYSIPEIVKTLMDQGVLEEIGQSVQSGFVTYPVMQILTDTLEAL